MFPVFPENFAEIHRQRLEDETEVLLVEEVAIQPQAVVLVVSVGLVQTPQQVELFQTYNENWETI